jgi:uncharacterized protein (TIGR01319 family)
VKAIALADFGSTFTKVTLVHAGTGELLARAEAPTTVRTDVLEGYRAALDEATGLVGSSVSICARVHASSAGGGLRMAAVGLVPELTAAAARQAALNAGAKVQLVLAGELDTAARAELEREAPEVLLFAGGTNGGQQARVLANAEVVASADADFTAVVACNEVISQNVAAIMRQGGRRVRLVPNVMPAFGTLNIEPARAAIGEEFVEHVICGKGLSHSKEFDQSVVMPTPQAVLLATQTLSTTRPAKARTGAGVVVVDVGGATTDVYSHAEHKETKGATQAGLLPIPPLIRTVQGDLGVRWNALNVFDSERAWMVKATAPIGIVGQQLQQACQQRAEHPELLAASQDDLEIDRALAACCVAVALRRHCGQLRITHEGRRSTIRRVEGGPDLRDARVLIGTGGAIVHDENGVHTIKHALGWHTNRSLTPAAPAILIDRNYILAASGLLSTIDVRLAANLLASELSEEKGQ